MTGQRILKVLKDFYRPNTGLSVATLARLTYASENHVRVVAKELEQNGRIVRKRGYPMTFQHIPVAGSYEAKLLKEYEAKLKKTGWPISISRRIQGRG